MEELLADVEATERTIRRLQTELVLLERDEYVPIHVFQNLRKSISDMEDHLQVLQTGESEFTRLLKNVTSIDNLRTKQVDMILKASVPLKPKQSFIRRLYERTARRWLDYCKNRWS